MGIFGPETITVISHLPLIINYRRSKLGNFLSNQSKDPVQGGFEIQLMDNEGFQKVNRVLPRKLNASFYDGVAPKEISQNPSVSGTKQN